MTHECWIFINSFSNWVAAFGTVAAVIVALYLARQDKKINLLVKASQGNMVGNGKNIDCIWVEATNIRHRPATIALLYWKTGIIRRQDFVWIPPVNPLSHGLPVKLQDGQQATWMLPVDEFLKANLQELQKFLGGRFLKWQLFTTFICARCSTGDVFKSRIGKSMRRFLSAHLKTSPRNK